MKISRAQIQSVKDATRRLTPVECHTLLHWFISDMEYLAQAEKRIQPVAILERLRDNAERIAVGRLMIQLHRESEGVTAAAQTDSVTAAPSKENP